LTEDDLEYLTDLKNRFWHEFSDLCEKYIREVNMMDPDLLDQAIAMLGESTSIYGRRMHH
jgi:hypothetical protein